MPKAVGKTQAGRRSVRSYRRSPRVPMVLLAAPLLAISWTLLWSQDTYFNPLFFTGMWMGATLLMYAVGEAGYPGWRRHAVLIAVSIPLWWWFELVNARVHNWEYINSRDYSGLEYFILATLAFSTVVPALQSAWGITIGLLHPPLVSPLRQRRRGYVAEVVGGLGAVLLVFAAPGLFFPLAWVGPFLAFDGLAAYGGGRSLIRELLNGEWRLAVAVGLAGLLCGVLWEFWNYWSTPKWIYHIKYLDFLHVFEMPLLGYGGYVPFAWSIYQILHLSPNPPKDTDGRREDSGRGWVRELQGRWPGVLGLMGGPADGLQSPHRAPKALCGSRDARDGERIRSRGLSRTGVVRVWGDVGSVAGWPSGREWNGLQPGQGATELGFPRPAPGEMQSEAAGRAGDPSHQSEDPPPEGLGDHGPLAQADARRPAGQVMRHHLDGQPGAVGGEARRRHVVQPDAVLEVAYGVLDLGVAAMIGLQFQGLPIAVGDEGVIAVSGEEGELGTGRRLHPPDNEPHRRGVRLGLERGVSRLGDIGGAVHPVGNGSLVLLWYRLDQFPQAGALADGDREADIHFPAGGNDSVGVEAAVGPHRELSPGPGVAHPPHRLTQEVGGATGGVGTALAQPGHQHLAGAGGNGQQRVIAAGAGIAVVARSLLGQSIGLADGRVQIDGQGRVAGSGPSGPGPGQQLAAHAVELTDMPSPEAAQEGP